MIRDLRFFEREEYTRRESKKAGEYRGTQKGEKKGNRKERKTDERQTKIKCTNKRTGNNGMQL